jgi:hypothetical protein
MRIVLAKKCSNTITRIEYKAEEKREKCKDLRES